MLQVFKSLPVANEVHPAGRVPPPSDLYAHDTITLGWEERMKSRGRRRSVGGVEFGTSLPRGTVLRGGDRLIVEAVRVVVEVVEQLEAVFVI